MHLFDKSRRNLFDRVRHLHGESRDLVLALYPIPGAMRWLQSKHYAHATSLSAQLLLPEETGHDTDHHCYRLGNWWHHLVGYHTIYPAHRLWLGRKVFCIRYLILYCYDPRVGQTTTKAEKVWPFDRMESLPRETVSSLFFGRGRFFRSFYVVSQIPSVSCRFLAMGV